MKSNPIQQKSRQGAAAVLILIMLSVLLTIGLWTINVSNVQRHRIGSQLACDLAARYCTNMVSRDEGTKTIKTVADQMVRSHTHMGANDGSHNVRVEFGTVKPGTNAKLSFKLGGRPTNAVRVSTQYSIPTLGVGSGAKIRIKNSATNAILERDVCLVLDRSGSMNFSMTGNYFITDGNGSRREFHPLNHLAARSIWHRDAPYWWWYRPMPDVSRWDAMIPAVYGLADELDRTKQTETLSIVSFSTASNLNWYTNQRNPKVRRFSHDVAEIEVRPTSNYRAAASQLDKAYQNDKLVTGGTNISAGIDLAVDVLNDQARGHAFKTIIVMTDGVHNGGRSPWTAAADAVDQDMEVFTVTFSRYADQASMKRTASVGNGKHFHADDGAALDAVFREIANIPPNVRIE